MSPIGPHPVLNVSHDSTYDFQYSSDRQDYFDAAVTTEAFFSFMSGLVVRKSRWDSTTLNPEFVGSCWAHAARLFEINQAQALKVKHIKAPLLLRRGGNDSFASNGLVNRYAIAIRGYNKIADTYFGKESREAWNIRRTLRNEYKFRSFLYAKFCCYTNPQKESLPLLNSLVDQFYCEQRIKHKIYRALYRCASKIPLALMISVFRFLKGGGKI